MKSTISTLRPAIWAIAIYLFVGTSQAVAAVIEEIVVTAQKREQNIQDVGIAISAVSGEQMRALGYTNAQQVTAMAPGVSTIQPNGEANYAIAIRGVANSDFTTNVESPVAVYLDEVYISQMSGAGFMLFDMDRVEILRGPQGTLFGRNATGGLAHYISRKPTDELDGYAQLTYGDYDQIKFEGAIGGGITETLAARLSISTNNSDGYVENRFTGKDLNDANDQAARLQLLFTPSDNGEILLSLRGSKQDIDTGFFENVTSLVGGQLTPGEPNPVLGGYVDNDGDVFAGDYDSPGFNELDTYGGTVTINWDFSNFTFTSITDFSSVERDYIEDSDASPVNFFNFYLTTDAEQLSQEFRVSGSTDRMNWVAGFYYLDLDIQDSNGAESEPFLDPASDTPFVTGLDNPYQINTKSMSVFGQVEYDLSEKLTGILGLRVINDEKDFEFATNVVDYVPGTQLRNGNPNILAPLASYEGDRDDTEVSIRLGLDYQATDNVLLYASYNRGVKGGGFNAPIFPLSPPLGYDDATLSYAPEQLDAFEVGFKARLADGLAFFNGAAYYYDYKDYQAFQIIGIDTITTNTDARSNGMELELQAAPTEGLDVILGVAYNDVDVDLNGFETTSVQSPQFNFNALLRYEFPLGNGRVALQYDTQYRSEHYFALTRADTVTENGYFVHNVSLGYIADSGRWEVRGFINNVSDEEYLVQTFDLSSLDVFALTEQYYGRPKWAGVSVAVHF